MSLLKVKSIIDINGDLKKFDFLSKEEKKRIATQLNKQAMESLGYKSKADI